MDKIKGPLPKFWLLHLWRVGYNSNKIELLLVFSSMIWDMELNEFIDALSSMVGYWSYIVLAWCQFIYGGWLLLILVDLDGLYIIEFIEPLSYPSEASLLSFLVLTLVSQN